MASKKAWYWLAAGVLALGLNSEYQSGKFQFIHNYVDHGLTVADAYARCAGRYLAQAHVLMSLMSAKSAQMTLQDDETNARNVLANQQVEYALARAEIARQEVEQSRPEIEKTMRELQCRRSELQMAQRIAADSADGNVVFCPRSRHVHVTVPEVRIPQVSVAVPRIHVAVPSINVQVPAVRVQAPEVNVSPMDDDSDDTL